MRTLALLFFLISTVPAVAAQDPGTPTIVGQKLETPPRIDGILDDRAWTAEPVAAGDWRSYNPLHGETIPQNTRVWVGYDADALYFAFECDDPEPQRIKTSGPPRQHRV